MVGVEVEVAIDRGLRQRAGRELVRDDILGRGVRSGSERRRRCPPARPPCGTADRRRCRSSRCRGRWRGGLREGDLQLRHRRVVVRVAEDDGSVGRRTGRAAARRERRNPATDASSTPASGARMIHKRIFRTCPDRPFPRGFPAVGADRRLHTWNAGPMALRGRIASCQRRLSAPIRLFGDVRGARPGRARRRSGAPAPLPSHLVDAERDRRREVERAQLRIEHRDRDRAVPPAGRAARAAGPTLSRPNTSTGGRG